MNIRPYQIENAIKGAEILKQKKFVYLIMQPRTGKTLTALEIAKICDYKNVLFITKKKAISSVISDYNTFEYTFALTVINNESLHTINDKFDLIISDENHRVGAFPKPSNTTKDIKKRFGHLPIIALSGTPSVESGSQWYHSFWISNYSPFKNYPTFYKWAKDFVKISKKRIGAFEINDYTESIDNKILPIIEPYLVKYTQQEAGFSSKVNKHIIYFNQDEKTNILISKLRKDLIVEGVEEVILADTSVKLMQKIHQLENGTIKFESGKSMTLSKTKAEFIKSKFTNKKIAIFYYFIEELNLLKEVFQNYTTDLNEFNTTDKIYIGQQYSNSLGVNLSKAESLVFYNFGYSGTNFIQAIDRLTIKERLVNDVYFIFEKNSLTNKIYQAVNDKKNYSDKLFKKQYGIQTPN